MKTTRNTDQAGGYTVCGYTKADKLVAYTVTIEGEAVTVGYYTTKFDKAFDELIYWLHTVESDTNNASVNVTFKTITE